MGLETEIGLYSTASTPFLAPTADSGWEHLQVRRPRPHRRCRPAVKKRDCLRPFVIVKKNAAGAVSPTGSNWRRARFPVRRRDAISVARLGRGRRGRRRRPRAPPRRGRPARPASAAAANPSRPTPCPSGFFFANIVGQKPSAKSAERSSKQDNLEEEFRGRFEVAVGLAAVQVGPVEAVDGHHAALEGVAHETGVGQPLIRKTQSISEDFCL